MITSVLILLIGMAVGGWLGVLVICMCIVAGESDRRDERHPLL